MKNHKVALVALALFIVVACVYPVSADILSDYTADYDESTQRVHAKITLTGGEEGAHASEYPRDFVILMDVSLSMRDVYKDKTGFEWAKNSTIDFLESLYAYKSRVGVISFSDDATEVCQLTFNFEEVKKGIESVSSHGFSTNYGEGIQKAVLVLKGREREALPVIILLTDGGEDKGVTNVEDAVDFAKKEGIMIYVVSFGQKEKIDDVMLRDKVVKPTGGEYGYTSFEGLRDALIGVQKLDEFLSAVNLRIVISQSSDAILDLYSIPSRPTATTGVIVTAKDKSSFTCAKLSENEKIEIEFDAFTAKEGDVNAGVVDVYYTDKDGSGKKLPISIKYNIPPSPSWKSYTLILGVATGVFFVLFILYFSKLRRKEKEVESYKDAKEELEKSLKAHVEAKKKIEENMSKVKRLVTYYMSDEKQTETINIIEEVNKEMDKIKER